MNTVNHGAGFAPSLRRCLSAFAAHIDAAREDAYDLSAEAIVAGLRASGLLRTSLPATDDGPNLAQPGKAGALLSVLRSLGACDLSAARLYEGHVNAAMLVRLYGEAEQQTAFANAIRRDALAGVWGADGAEPLEADVSGGGVTLRGGKILASGAGLAEAAIATARTEAGPLMLLLGPIAKQRIDLSGWTPLGMSGSATGSVDLSGLSLPLASVLGRPGDFLRQPHFSGGAWRFCAAHLGAAERLLDLFRAHLVARGRQSDPYQVQRVALATVAVKTAALWIGEAARRSAEPEQDPATTVGFVNLTRGVTERAALDVIEIVERGIGLSALVKPHPAERVIRDLSTYLRQPVPDLAMADAAKFVLASALPTAELWT